ncbi:MAG: hypothetical protein ACRCUT_07615, partial [Spirochaetota bacterium]
MMKKTKLLLSLLLIPAVLIACGDDGGGFDPYNMSNLPSKFKGEIPGSIKGDGSANGSVRTISKNILRSTGGASQGCTQLKQMTGYLEYDFQNVAMMAVIADAAISQNDITADETAHNGTVKLTEGMAETIGEILGDTEDTSWLDECIGEKFAAT